MVLSAHPQLSKTASKSNFDRRNIEIGTCQEAGQKSKKYFFFKVTLYNYGYSKNNGMSQICVWCL